MKSSRLHTTLGQAADTRETYPISYCVSYAGASQAGWHGHAPLRDQTAVTRQASFGALAAASHPPMTDALVRRDKALVLSGRNTRPATGSLRPEAIGAAAEATKPPKPLVERVPWGLREPTGRNASERRAGLETVNAGADLPIARGRLSPTRDAESDRSRGVLPGQWRRHVGGGNRTQHGKSRVVEACDLQPEAREGRTGPHGMAERPVVPTTVATATRGKGPWLKAGAGSGEGSGDCREAKPRPRGSRSCGWRTTRKRRVKMPVGESVKPSPRAGCGKSARPVR